MSLTPHHDKLVAVIANPKCHEDKKLLEDVLERYDAWVKSISELDLTGKDRVDQMVDGRIYEFGDLVLYAQIKGRYVGHVVQDFTK
ncbi:MAG: hypothetical protein JRI34_14080 [Deltaproteobacteria bacterium]|nr:hypothetical protein [Deltaproteobacteria bacterium]